MPMDLRKRSTSTVVETTTSTNIARFGICDVGGISILFL